MGNKKSHLNKTSEGGWECDVCTLHLFIFSLKFQTPVTLCSGEVWSILVVRLAHPRLCRPEVSASPCVWCTKCCLQHGVFSAGLSQGPTVLIQYWVLMAIFSCIAFTNFFKFVRWLQFWRGNEASAFGQFLGSFCTHFLPFFGHFLSEKCGV